MSSEQIIYFDKRGEPTNTPRTQQRSLPRLLEIIRDHAIEQLQGLFKEMLDGADDALFDLADKARSNKDQSLFFDSMRELRIKRKGMENIFGQQLGNKFQQLKHALSRNNNNEEIVVDELPMDSFALVQEDELEENLAVDSMVEKARNVNCLALQQIEMRLDTILANVRVEGSNNPVDPKNISEAFREASHTLELDIKAKLIVYKLFDRMVMTNLHEVYTEINNFLIKNGVLPELDLSDTEKSKKSHYRRRASDRQQSGGQANENAEGRDSEGAGPGYGDASGEDSIGVEVLGALRELLAVQRSGGGSTPLPVGMGGAPVPQNVPATGYPPSSASPVVDNQQLIHALSTVQNAISNQQIQGNAYLPVADLRGQIGTNLPIEGPVTSQAIGQANDDVIDIISMLFDFILDDKNLPDEFKALIGRLQIPMLKVAILDDTFFSKGNHPARKLLNEMARAGIGWTKETTGGVGLRSKVEEIVSHVVEEFDDDTSLFEGLLDDFHAFLAEQQKRALIVEKRTREAEEGKARAESARYKVESALEAIVGDRDMPDAVNRLLFEAWENVMLLDYLKEGEYSESWKRNLDTAQKLVQTLKPPKNKTQRKQLTSQLSNLVKNIKAGLDAIAYGEFESAKLFQELEQIHLRVLKGEMVYQQKSTQTEDNKTGTQQDQSNSVENRPVEKVVDASETLAKELAQFEVENVDSIFATEASNPEQITDLADMEEITFSEADLEKLNSPSLHRAQKAASVAAVVQEELEQLNAQNENENENMTQEAITESENFDDQFIEEIDMTVPAGYNTEEIEDMGSLPEDDEFIKKVESVQVGYWFEIRNFEKPLRCKLAAIIPSVGKYIFVNRTGVKVAEFTKSGLALAFRRDEISQLNDGALFDRALESIVTNLRSLKKTQGEGLH